MVNIQSGERQFQEYRKKSGSKLDEKIKAQKIREAIEKDKTQKEDAKKKAENHQDESKPQTIPKDKKTVSAASYVGKMPFFKSKSKAALEVKKDAVEEAVATEAKTAPHVVESSNTPAEVAMEAVVALNKIKETEEVTLSKPPQITGSKFGDDLVNKGMLICCILNVCCILK